MRSSVNPQSGSLNPIANDSVVSQTSGNICVEVVTDLEELVHYQSAWDRLALAAPRPIPMSSAAWIIPYVKHRLREQERWAVLFAFDGSEMVGVLPLLICPHRVFGMDTVQLRTMFGPHTYSVDILADGPRESEIITALLANLDKVDKHWHHLVMRRLSPTSPLFNFIEQQPRSLRQYSEECDSGSYFRTIGDFDDYYKSLSRKTRRALAGTHNRVNRLDDVRFVFLPNGESTEARVQDFIRVDAASWRGKAGYAIDSDPSVLSFYREVIQRLAELGWLEWHFMEVDNLAVAAQLAVKMGRRLIIKRISYDESFASYGPGNILFERSLMRAFASEDIDEVDFLTDMPWHDKWQRQKHVYRHLWVYAPRSFPFVTGYLPARAKVLLRRIPGLVSAFHFVSKLARRIRGERP
ncbi:MAG: GNAT family N-acetyltransferase [candidate division Zixibacteria bacterium]|nr:GNAT family N-acetyltransferase [candidate division Zixibacteria bacterium]MDH3936465.1 GNAT family N-acetyltransferase [candidate division Zixibacteria bacterium]